MARRHPAVHGLAFPQDVVRQSGPAQGGLDQEEGLDAVVDEPRLVQREGQGIALGREMMVADDIARGSLVRLFDVSVPVPFSYYMVCPPALAQTSKVKRFRTWMKSSELTSLITPNVVRLLTK